MISRCKILSDKFFYQPNTLSSGLGGLFRCLFQIGFLFVPCSPDYESLKTKFDTNVMAVITNYNTIILVRSVIKFLDRNFLFFEKVQVFLYFILSRALANLSL